MIDEGLLGKIITVQAVIGLAGIREIGCPGYMADWMEDPIRGGGGALIDEGAHAFDLLHWLVGDLESVCSATARTAKPALKVEDNAMTLLRFEGGALGSLSTLWSLNIDIGMRSTLQLFGTNGTLFVDLTTKAPGVCLYSESAVDKALQGWTSPHIKPGDTEPHDYLSWPIHVQHYKREVTDVVKRFQSGEPFRTTFRDALKVARVTEAAYRSARENRFVSIEKEK
jgi:predicted dehydrogenase